MASELVAAEEFMRSQCVGNGALVTAVPGGFHSERQHSTPGRFVYWTFQGGLPNTLGEHGIRILTHPLYLVRVVDKIGSYLPLQTAADLLDTVLTSAAPFSYVLNGKNYTVQSCIQERPFSLVDRYVDLEWRHLGGYYRLEISPF